MAASSASPMPVSPFLFNKSELLKFDSITGMLGTMYENTVLKPRYFKTLHISNISFENLYTVLAMYTRTDLKMLSIDNVEIDDAFTLNFIASFVKRQKQLETLRITRLDFVEMDEDALDAFVSVLAKKKSIRHFMINTESRARVLVRKVVERMQESVGRNDPSLFMCNLESIGLKITDGSMLENVTFFIQAREIVAVDVILKDRMLPNLQMLMNVLQPREIRVAYLNVEYQYSGKLDSHDPVEQQEINTRRQNHLRREFAAVAAKLNTLEYTLNYFGLRHENWIRGDYYFEFLDRLLHTSLKVKHLFLRIKHGAVQGSTMTPVEVHLQNVELVNHIRDNMQHVDLMISNLWPPFSKRNIVHHNWRMREPSLFDLLYLQIDALVITPPEGSSRKRDEREPIWIVLDDDDNGDFPVVTDEDLAKMQRVECHKKRYM